MKLTFTDATAVRVSKTARRSILSKAQKVLRQTHVLRIVKPQRRELCGDFWFQTLTIEKILVDVRRKEHDGLLGSGSPKARRQFQYRLIHKAVFRGLDL